MFQQLINLIISRVYPNNNSEISGTGLQEALLEMVDQLGEYEFKGIAVPSTVPENTEKAIYAASTEGSYVNFDNISLLSGEICFLKKDGLSWNKLLLLNITQQTIAINVDEDHFFGDGGTTPLSGFLYKEGDNTLKISRGGLTYAELTKVTTGGGFDPTVNDGQAVFLRGIDRPTIVTSDDLETGVGILGASQDPFSGGFLEGRIALWSNGKIVLVGSGDSIRIPLLSQASKNSPNTPTNFLFLESDGTISRKDIAAISGSGSSLINGAFVSHTHGDDGQAIYGSSDHPYKTISAAISAMQEGHTLYVLDGDHTVSSPHTVMFNIKAYDGTKITFSSALFFSLNYSGNLSFVFSEISGIPIFNSCNVTGGISLLANVSTFSQSIGLECSTFDMELRMDKGDKIPLPNCKTANVRVTSFTSQDVSIDCNPQLAKVEFVDGFNGTPSMTRKIIATNKNNVIYQNKTMNLLCTTNALIEVQDESGADDLKLFISGVASSIKSFLFHNSVKIICQNITLTSPVESFWNVGTYYCSGVIAKSPPNAGATIDGSYPLILDI